MSIVAGGPVEGQGLAGALSSAVARLEGVRRRAATQKARGAARWRGEGISPTFAIERCFETAARPLAPVAALLDRHTRQLGD